MHARGLLVLDRLACGGRLAVAANELSSRGISTQLPAATRYRPKRSPQTQRRSNMPAPRVYLMNSYKPPPIDLDVALRALRAYSFVVEPETLQLSLECNMVIKKGKLLQPFRATVAFPHKFGRLQRILFVGESDEAMRLAQQAGADIVGDENILEKIKSEELTCDEFDMCLCSSSVYSAVQKYDKILRAKTPSTRKGTVVDSNDGIADAVSRSKQSLEYRTVNGSVNMPVGELDFTDTSVAANIQTLVDSVVAHRPLNTPKIKFIKRAMLSSTFGPKFDVDIVK